MPGTSPPDERLRVMPWWLVLIGLLLAALLGWWVLYWLLGEADRAAAPDTRATLRIDAIRTGLTVVAGTGGGLALLLAARRQWISERAQRHQEVVAAADQSHRDRVQAHVEAVAEAGQRHQEHQAETATHDAAERRLTELYTRAVELLGNDNAAVRLGGLHALERLAQDNPAQRTTIVGVLCAYLRMPSPDDARETEVRRSAQRMLTRHLRADGDVFWPGMRLDLTGARLDDFDATGCSLDDADLTGATCTGTTRFTGATLTGRLALGASFDALVLDGVGGDATIVLDDARVTGGFSADGAEIGGQLSCQRATIGETSWRGTTFRRTVTFDHTSFGGSASFRDAAFQGGLSLEHTTFGGDASFRRAHFADLALFRWTEFGGEVSFADARFAGSASFGRARFHGPVTFEGVTTAHRPLFDQARATTSAHHTWPDGTHVEPLDTDWLLLTDP
ncbi:pentapeptide repeat-containing protein [Verrucosispora sp. WMMD1129]|uniref:pentapeptide repeat-containing protein n=1 Tax=Verrucosispora sp. WMMD1129 TaxID=3016093 RepID=UPI00249B86F9|nr:pentapeptide repeat-containing protein [Verrucosispora sp. WMMD1129]WFE47330.1 pentapeptide repeat-containing protein [Verrucosispora sp. WMMD1129]